MYPKNFHWIQVKGYKKFKPPKEKRKTILVKTKESTNNAEGKTPMTPDTLGHKCHPWAYRQNSGPGHVSAE